MYNLDRGGEKFRKTYGKLSFRFSASESGAVALPPLCSRSSLSRLPSPAAIVASPGSSVDLRAQDQGKPLIRHEYTTPRPVSMPTIAPRVNEPHGHARGFSTSWRSVAFRKERSSSELWQQDRGRVRFRSEGKERDDRILRVGANFSCYWIKKKKKKEKKERKKKNIQAKRGGEKNWEICMREKRGMGKKKRCHEHS